MSDYGYPKFAWMARVAEDDRLSDAARLILVYIANQNVRGPEDTFCVRQATVAANLHKKRQTVGEALAKARELGWLELARERKRGRGQYQANTYRITFTEIGPPRGTSFDQEYVRGEDEIGPRWGQEYVRGEDEICPFDTRQNTASPAETPTLQGIDTGFSNTGCKSQGVARERADDEPTHIPSIFGGLFNSSESRQLEAPKQHDTSEPLDVEEVDAAAGPPCDVCAVRPAIRDGKCGQCLCVAAMESKPQPTAAPVIRDDPEETRARELARLRQWQDDRPDEDSA